jgi:muconolactone delta-isomerase
VQFLSLSTRRSDRFSDAEFASLVDAEIERARELYADGFIRQIWHRGDRPGACILIEADSLEQARARLQTLPLIRAGMLDVSIVPLMPYAGFRPVQAGLQPVAGEDDA